MLLLSSGIARECLTHLVVVGGARGSQFLGSELHVRPLLVAPGAGGDGEGQTRRMAELNAPLVAVDASLARHLRREGEERLQATAFSRALARPALRRRRASSR